MVSLPRRARISWGRAMRGGGPEADLSLSRSGQRHIDAPWPREFNQGPYVPEHVLDTAAGHRPCPVTTLWLPFYRLVDRAKGVYGTERNPASRSQPASIGDHWLCPWYSAPISSSSACIVASRRSRTNDLTAYLGCREDGSVYTPTPAIDLILQIGRAHV